MIPRLPTTQSCEFRDASTKEMVAPKVEVHNKQKLQI